MIHSRTLLVGTLALGLSLAACGDDSGGDVCDGLILCTVEGTSCSGAQIVTCAADSNGCLVETVDQDCASAGQACDDSGAAPMCVDAGCDDLACVGASDGDVFCDGDGLVSCNADTDGCLVATTNDCAATGRICDDVVSAAGCYDDCTDDTRCTGASEGDTACDGDTLLTCVTVPGGCLVAEASNCQLFGDTCDDSGDPAVCAAGACSDDALCAGRADGETWCDGDLLNTCTTGGDGCLDLSQVGCGPGTCDAGGSPAVCTTPTESGEDCANAYVINNTTTFTTADITTYANDLTFTDASCQMRMNVPDVVFQVDLLDGETLYVAEYGGADTVVNLQVGTCGEGLACVSSQDDPDSGAQMYTASGAETVYITVEPYFETPTATDVALTIAIDRSCGNGFIEPGEQCDDGGTATGDGCSDTCTVEFGWFCDGVSPSSCTEYPSIGSFGAGDPIGDVANTANLPAGYRDTFQITFTEDVVLSGTLTVPGLGDPDFALFATDGAQVLGSATDGPESFTGYVPAGTYVAVVDIYFLGDDADQGYVLSLSTQSVLDGGTVGDGGSLSFTGGPLAAGSSEFYTVTLSEDVLLTFDLTSDDGATSDMDFVIHTAAGQFITAVADDFDEVGRSVALQAGTYVFEFNAYADTADAVMWSFSGSTASAAWSSIGSFAAGDTISDTTGGPLTQRDYDHYEITFTEPVLLSGTLGGNGTGVVGLYVYDATRNWFGSFTADDETITDLALPAGTYIIQVLTVSETFGGGDVDTYTLSLSTTTP